VFKLCHVPNEPLPNESLVLRKKIYAIINRNLLCHKLWLWMRLFAIRFVNLGLALCSVELVTLKKQIVGEIPSFSNHAGN
jgi:NADH:ubiquinone oxidoreductase subunit B-like Fe-S oxidoreductase